MNTQTTQQNMYQYLGELVKWWSDPFTGQGILREIHFDGEVVSYTVEDIRNGKSCGNWFVERIKPIGEEQPLKQGINRDNWEQVFSEKFPLIGSSYIGVRHGQTREYLYSDNPSGEVKGFIHELLKSIDEERGHQDD